MSYPSDDAEISARFRPTGEVESLTFRSGTVVRFVAPGSVTNGQFGLFEWDMRSGQGGAGPHFHKTFSESFYVVSGRVRFYDGRTWVTGEKGDFLYVPAGGAHAFENPFDEPASMLILFSPGAPREDFFRELIDNASAGRQLTPAERAAMLARHDQYDAGPAA